MTQYQRIDVALKKDSKGILVFLLDEIKLLLVAFTNRYRREHLPGE